VFTVEHIHIMYIYIYINTLGRMILQHIMYVYTLYIYNTVIDTSYPFQFTILLNLVGIYLINTRIILML